MNFHSAIFARLLAELVVGDFTFITAKDLGIVLTAGTGI